MPSTTRPHPSRSDTATWRAVRSRFADHLTHVGPLPCRAGGQPITATDQWDLGHDTAHALGGTTDLDNLWPEHAHATPGCCDGNRSAGATLGNQLRRQPIDHGPSRDW